MRIALLVLVLAGYSSHAQVLISLLLGDKLNTGKIEFGLDGGVNYPSIRGLEGGEARSTFNIGFYFDIKLKDSAWMVHTGVLVKSTMGESNLPVYTLGDPDLDNVFAGGQVQARINYFNVPIMMKYKFNRRIYAEAGIMPSLRAKAYDIFTAENNGDLEYKLETGDKYHRLDFGLIAGVGYRLMGGNGMNLGVRYYLGLVDITIDDTTPDQYNSSLYLSVGIPIGAGKAKAKSQNNTTE
ncbi:MAG TPA: porin family protein [Chryseolinea sp.]